MVYQPTPVGEDPTSSDSPFSAYADSRIWRQDFPKLQNLGANVIRLYQPREIHETSCDIGMFRPLSFLNNRQRALVKRLGSGIVSFILIKLGQIVQGFGDRGMLRPQILFIDRECLFIQRLGFGIFSNSVRIRRCSSPPPAR